MKLLKIGSSPACDIVINEPYVSALHAEVTVLDNGEIIIEDKNSTNGTFVGNQKITPNSEVSIRRGDYVRLGNVPLPWNRIPSISPMNKYKQMVNIGSNFRNEIVVSNSAVSRYHATLKISVDNKAFLCDNGSRNGTQVNGQKLQPGRDVRIKRGDNIMIAGEDVTDMVLPYLPKSNLKNVVYGVCGSAIAAVVAYLVYLVWPGSTSVDPSVYQQAVVYIHSAYHYEISVSGYTLRWTQSGNEYDVASSTGFFVDREGRIGTARHVAVPWDEAYTKETRQQLQEAFRESFCTQIRVAQVTNEEELRLLKSTEIGRELLESSNSLGDLNNRINQLRMGNIDITGKMDFFAVGYNGNNYENISEFKRCSLVAESGDAKKDVALLQLNEKETPHTIGLVFDLSKVTEKPLRPMEDNLYTIGFPNGFLWSYESDSKEIKNSIRETKCSKKPGKYDFEFQTTSQPGASGSPVFLPNGQLVGILSAAYSSGEGSPTVAAHAYFLKTLYDESVGVIAK